MSSSVASVYGLILAGGASSRMGRDKATLVYRGKNQLERTFELLGHHVSKVFVSTRPDQASEPTRSRIPLILDSESGGGPIVGILSAFAAFPEAAWLVVACDLPFLSDESIARLLVERDPTVLATAYLSAHDGLPEPLCALWEPAAAAPLAAYQRTGGLCPRKFLRSHTIRLLEPSDRQALDNINTPQEYALASGTLDAEHASPPRRLTIQYFALMREQAGRSEESLETTATTPQELYSELTRRYGFTLTRAQLKVAVNSEFSNWSRPLHAGDAVVFIPPVAGG